jgi:hypothetical protein
MEEVMLGKIITALSVVLVSGSLAFAAPATRPTNSSQAKPAPARATMNQSSTAKSTMQTHKKSHKKHASSKTTASSRAKSSGLPSKGAPPKQ